LLAHDADSISEVEVVREGDDSGWYLLIHPADVGDTCKKPLEDTFEIHGYHVDELIESLRHFFYDELRKRIKNTRRQLRELTEGIDD